MKGEQPGNDDDAGGFIRQLAGIEARYGAKQRLARVLSRPSVRRAIATLAAATEPTTEAWLASPLGRTGLEPLWREAAALTDAVLQLGADGFRCACERWTPGAPFATELFAGTNGVLARSRREADFLAARHACAEAPTPARASELARGAAAFEADLAADVRLFRRAMRELRVRARAPLVAHAYGFGEISRTVGLVRHTTPFVEAIAPARVVYKRLAPFTSAELAARYIAMYQDYNRRLREDVGIMVPDFGHRTLRDARGQIVVLVTQALLEPRSNAKEILRGRDAEQCRLLFRMVLDEYRKLIRYNATQAAARFQIGIDGQAPNWAVRNYGGDGASLRGDEGLFYMDTNTPMMRTHGQECLPIDFYLQAVPRLFRLMARPMARKVLDRYFDPRTILLDFLANTSIHGRGDLVPDFLAEGNAFLQEGLIQPTPRPITGADVERYIASDIATWRLTRSLRKVQEMIEGARGPIATARLIHHIYTRPIF
jgi:hypothetical protein